MGHVQKKKTMLQWHPAFYAGIQIEFAAEKEMLIFESEHQIGTRPKQIDVLIIKKNSRSKLQKNIGHIFRAYNIIEYKSPEDYLSVDDFYKVYGYACFYKSDTSTLDAIKAEELTLTFVCDKYPQKLVQYLRTERKYKIENYTNGIYYIYGDYIPMQIIVISQLSEEDNFWLHHLRNDVKTIEEAERIVIEYKAHQNENLYKSVMNLIVAANKEVFREARDMCEALMELFSDKFEATRLEGAYEKVEKQVQIKLTKGKSIDQIADELEEDVDTIKSIIEKLQNKEVALL